jgi:hypothetical protein
MIPRMCCVLLFSIALSCSWYRQDRCWVSDARFTAAQQLYDRTGSLDVVVQTLRDEGWGRCEINEAVYRLKKVNHLE